MQTVMPGIPFQPLCPVGDMNPLQSGTPTVLIFHTMDGYLDGSMNEWASGGCNGVTPHFNVAGSWDVPAHPDGWANQIRPIDREGCAQWAGNAYATSVETSDGATEDKVGGWAPPWTAAQLDTLVGIGVWWCGQTGNPAVLVDAPTGRGIGYHRQFDVWNQSNHACPGSNRESQLARIVIPRIAAALTATVPPPINLGDDVLSVIRSTEAGADQRLPCILRPDGTRAHPMGSPMWTAVNHLARVGMAKIEPVSHEDYDAFPLYPPNS